MPKEMIRLNENRVTGRSFDDRVGCAALILSLNKINPRELKNKITFVWSVEEEIGLRGAKHSAINLKNASIVYPVDTYVSSDDPYKDESFANAPLGNGAVIRVLESINFVSRENFKMIRKLADNNNIKTQYGMTSGGTDGQPFLSYGIPSVPISWPGRYSHSPIEIMDLRDKAKKYRKERNDNINNLNNQRLSATEKMISLIRPILSEYSEKNSISLIIQKRNIVIGKTSLDITDDILKIVDEKIGELQLD